MKMKTGSISMYFLRDLIEQNYLEMLELSVKQAVSVLAVVVVSHDFNPGLFMFEDRSLQEMFTSQVRSVMDVSQDVNGVIVPDTQSSLLGSFSGMSDLEKLINSELTLSVEDLWQPILDPSVQNYISFSFSANFDFQVFVRQLRIKRTTYAPISPTQHPSVSLPTNSIYSFI